MPELPTDPFILLSAINMVLRDESGTPQEICSARDWSWKAICESLSAAGFEYDETARRFW